MRPTFRLVILTSVVLAGVLYAPRPSAAQWRWGGSTEFSVPLGDLNQISLLGLSAVVYAGTEIQRATWAIELNSGIHWFVPEKLPADEVPDWVPNPEVDNNGEVVISGSFIPIRGSITRFFGRYYVSPRVGAYIPVGDFRKEAEMSTVFGIAPRIGYFFPITRGSQFDFGFEYNYLFSDISAHYFGVSMGLFFGGYRLRR